MARQEIDLTTPQPNGKMGEPTKSAWEKVNDMTEELYDGVSLAANALPKTGGTMTGGILRAGVFGGENFRIYNNGSERGIGGAFSSWGGDRQPALQVDAQLPSEAYMPIRVTRWGVQHIFAVDITEGGTGPSAQAQVGFHFSTGILRHQFIDNGSLIIAGTLTQNSDYRIKVDVETIDPSEAAAALRMVRPVEYTDTDDSGKRPRRAGVIAHELQDALPLLVHGTKDEVQTVTVMEGDTIPYGPGMEPDDYVPPVPVQRQVPKLQNVNYAGMSPYLAAGWQEHDSRLYALEEEIINLKSVISNLMEK